MNISLNKASDLQGRLTVVVTEADYKEKVEAKLKDYRKKASIKGFRPGMVPATLIKKLYGQSALVDEINHELGHAVSDYIKENKLNLVGEPLPAVEEADAIDWEKDTEFTFHYDLGFHGDFTVDLAKMKAIQSYEIKADKKEIDETIENLKKQFGEQTHPESVEDRDLVFGTFTQGDWVEKSAIPMHAIQDKSKKVFVGAKKGDTLKFAIDKVFVDAKALALATGKKEEEVAELKGEVSYVVEDITRQVPSEMNVAFFDKVLGPGKATDEKSFRAEVETIVGENYAREAKYLLRIDAEKAILESVKIDLPEEFLRTWLIRINEGKFTPEQIDQDFDNVKRDIRWNLIKNEIAEKFDVKVDYPEVVEKAKDMVRQQFGGYLSSDQPGIEEMIEKIAMGYLSDKSKGDNFMNLYNQAFSDKVSNAIVENIPNKTTKIDVDKFKEIAAAL
ncbi:trigger factor [Aquirufa regiilacus]|uniref:Trigger factor n=1 Tax=Aquirufa regiilacus TaxID=3024868 RepID=A0ABU3TPF3_9BACT|nr:trigger factor [Aquirufa sp. LEOWEIH-7C]MBP6055125.1 trigger factor [Cytophagaceae bacterium]MBP6093593.1 trigger factor [Cytophagaceae bacterium]MDU0807714.1 trigger factor [Aquirufa sp. LEOWEIH-7C]